MDLSQQHRVDRIIIFTRYPEVGKAKTRLIPKLGSTIATYLHRRLAEYTLEQCRDWRSNSADFSQTQKIITVCFNGGDRALMAAWLGDDLDYQIQGQGDLGEKIIRILQYLAPSVLAQNLRQELALDLTPETIIANRLVIIGTDCPELKATHLDQAFQMLGKKDLVLGKAEDGGYYLIGLKQVIPQLFQGISWGSDRVFAETVEIAKSLGLSIGYLPILRDIDRPEDLIYLLTLANFEDFIELKNCE